jgi:uncharacterized membrane protein YfcA
MTEHLIIGVASFFVALLTFFSGFGLGTLLMPAFVFILHNVEWAIAATAVVHLANNLFKLVLVGRHANFRIVLRFGIPAVIMSFAGAFLLVYFAGVPPLMEYRLGGNVYSVTALKLVIGLLILFFALFDLIPGFRHLAFDARYLPLGGVLSGFFGGLSGHQGPLRSAFLIRSGLTREGFIGTGVVCAVMVDIARLLVYGFTVFGRHMSASYGNELEGLVLTGIACAFVGSLLGARLVKKVAMRVIHMIVGVLLVLMALALGAGMV